MEEKKAYFEKSFGELKESIGKTVSCLYWEFGKLEGYRGTLEDIEPYDFINIEGKLIQFVGERTAIQYVLAEEQDVVYSIYKNEDIKDYKGSFRDPMQVINAQKKYLGVSVAEEEMNTRRR